MKNNVILNFEIIEIVINIVNFNDNFLIKLSNFIFFSIDFLINKIYFVNNMDEYILDFLIVDY